MDTPLPNAGFPKTCMRQARCGVPEHGTSRAQLGGVIGGDRHDRFFKNICIFSPFYEQSLVLGLDLCTQFVFQSMDPSPGD